jgi:hypothetical protein
MAQPGARPSQIVRSQNVDARQLRVFPNNPPDHFLADAITPHMAGPADTTENESGFNSRGGNPGVDGQFYPGRHGDSANVAALAKKIDDCPMLVSLLKMGHAQPNEF